MPPNLSIDAQITEVLGKHHEQAISDVATATGWTVAASQVGWGMQILSPK